MANNSFNATPPRLRPLSGIFSATQRPGVATLRRELRETMIHKLLGLPYDEWMAAFLPANDTTVDDASFDGLFDKVPIGSGETEMYKPFVDALNGAEPAILDRFVLAKTFDKTDKSDKDKKKADGGMYPRDSPAVAQERTDWASVEVFIECKSNLTCDPYDEDTLSGHPYANTKRDALGQIATYASSVFEFQHRTHHFSVVLLGSWARLARWDRSGVIFSSKFDYKQEPTKLVRFFWRVARASAEVRGHDTTATRVLPGSGDYELLQAWKAKDKTLADDDYVAKRFVKSLSGDRPWWRLTVSDKMHGSRDFLVGRPTFAAAGVVGRGTRGYIALSISDPARPLVYLKDCWRMVQDRSKLEGNILSDLNEKGVANIPTALYHGDVEGQLTVSQTSWKPKPDPHTPSAKEENPFAEVDDVAVEAVPTGSDSAGQSEDADPGEPEYVDAKQKQKQTKIHCRMKTHQHYRLVVKEVGIPLQEFPSGRVLVRVIADAIAAHEDAYNKAEVMHRDVSIGNILIIPPNAKQGKKEYQGLLTDWELSKRRSDENAEPRHPDRTGTWQFMSVHTLSKPEAQVQIADELESFLHIMIYCAIRYLPHTCDDVGEFMYSFFDDGRLVEEAEYTCGYFKRSVMKEGQLHDLAGKRILFLRTPRPPKPKDRSTTTKKMTVHPHPIGGLIITLLQWFSARYRLLPLEVDDDDDWEVAPFPDDLADSDEEPSDQSKVVLRAEKINSFCDADAAHESLRQDRGFLARTGRQATRPARP
ncbi:hypothetical protein BN946_scf184875.g2 [Trametes cinnabarina]|uniref:Fungal-type protein kinase domain-containing protein n=1 Tax=Pycnoporus cinnabarinus TaxID=5643 RepID=A0A060SBD3_PYCCI|nr:hypothetical protein BN946_scf184875.g2 [Trametes cinnabarina]